MEYDFCIVGGGIAGVSCIEQILELNSDARILLISSSSVVKEASNVVKLTKTLQDFVIVQKSLKSFKDVHQSVQIIHDYVQSLDHKNHMVNTSSNGSFKYKKLCICTGASPKVIFPHLVNDRILGIRDTDSVQQLIQKTTTARRILLVGNGGIATEFVYEVKGVDVIWAIKDRSISSHYLDSSAAEFFIQCKLKTEKNFPTDQDGVGPCKRMKYTMSDELPPSTSSQCTGVKGSALGPDWSEGLALQGLLKEKNISIQYQSELSRIFSPQEYAQFLIRQPNMEREDQDWPIYIELSSGLVTGCDFIVSATGVKLNCTWFNGRCDPEGGIFVNKTMETSLPDVFAAGDICTPEWTPSKHWFQMRLWTQARQMGLFAGKCMEQSLNSPELFQEIEPDFCFELFSHVTKFFGYKVVLLGLYNGQGIPKEEQSVIIRCSKDTEYVKVVIHNSRMQGALLIGETGLEETFENLILNQIDVSPFGEDLLNPDIDIEDYFD